MTELDYWHKVGGQRWLAQKLGIDLRIAKALERIAESLPFDEELRTEIREALEGDSNDAEHDALVSVAQAIGIDYDVIDDD